MNRHLLIPLAVFTLLPALLPALEPEAAAQQAHEQLWKRFVDKHGILLDFTDLNGEVSLPTPEECKDGKPNALGWWAPIENGAMFNGLYMDAAVNRWKHTQKAEDAEKARKLMQGLIKLNSISPVKGFVGRGVSTDGVSHYAMGSNDQTLPWFLGLWRYLKDGPVTNEERALIEDRLRTTAEVIVKDKWSMPAEEPFRRRGGFGGVSFDSVPRQLFVMKLMHQLTKDEKWQVMYDSAVKETVTTKDKEQRTRLQVCEAGMVFEYAKFHSWTSCCSVGALRALWEMETDEALRASFAKGLQASADLAFKSLPMAQQFDVKDKAFFDMDWRRTMLPLWKPQKTEQEAQDLAHEQLKAFMKASPQRGRETNFVREPTAACWVVTLAPDTGILKSRAEEVEKVIAHYDYSQLYYSTFFWVESAWWRLQDVK